MSPNTLSTRVRDQLEAIGYVAFEHLVPCLRVQQVICHIERRHYSNPIEANNATAVTDFKHLGIQDFCRVQEIRALACGACDLVFLVQNSDADLGCLIRSFRIPVPLL